MPVQNNRTTTEISIANKENIVDQGTKVHAPTQLERLVEPSTTTSFYPSAKGFVEIQLDSPSNAVFCKSDNWDEHISLLAGVNRGTPYTNGVIVKNIRCWSYILGPTMGRFFHKRRC